MAHPKLPDETIQEIIRLRRSGLSLRDIGQKLGIAFQVAGKYVRRYGGREMPYAPVGDKAPMEKPVDAAPETAPPVAGPPPLDGPGVVDRTDIDGTIQAVKLERPMSIEEMMAACRLDPARWVPQWFRGNAWQGFAKMRIPMGGKDGAVREEIRKVP